MSNSNGKTVTLNYQGRVDGTVEAFEVNGMMAIPSEDGVTYVRWQDVVDFFSKATSDLPESSDIAAGILQSFIEHNGPDFAAKIQPVIDHLQGKSPSPSSIQIKDYPDGATHYQPNIADRVAGLFWRFDTDRWAYWYNGEWSKVRNEGLPPGLVKIKGASE